MVKLNFFFETHRHIGHIERVIFFKIKLNLKTNTPFYVSYVPMCFKKKDHFIFYSLLSSTLALYTHCFVLRTKGVHWKFFFRVDLIFEVEFSPFLVRLLCAA
jgi:hypothetical protein